MPEPGVITKGSNILLEFFLIVLIILTPLLYGSIGFAHYTIMELVVIFMALIWLIKMASLSKISFVRVSFALPVLLFALVVVLQTLSLPRKVLDFLSPNSFIFYNLFSPLAAPAQSWLKLSINPQATIVELFKVLSYLAVFFLVLNNIQSKQQFQRIFNVIICLGLVVCVFGIIQKYAYSNLGKIYWFNYSLSASSPFGPFANRNHFAGYIEMIIPLAIGYIITDIQLHKKLFYGLAVCIMSLGLFLSTSRAGIIVYISTLLFMCFFAACRERLRRQSLTILLLFAAVLLGSFFLLQPELIIKRFAALFPLNQDIAFFGRGYLWKDLLRIWRDFPLFGTGLGTFANISAKYKTIFPQVKFSYAHNDYLQLLCETGIIGFGLVFSFFILYLSSLLKAWFNRRDDYVLGLTLGGAASIWAILLHSLVDFNLHVPSNALLFFIIMALTYRLAFTRFKRPNVFFE